MASRPNPLDGYTVEPGAIRYLGEDHIRDCVQVCKSAQLMLPPPDAEPVAPDGQLQ